MSSVVRCKCGRSRNLDLCSFCRAIPVSQPAENGCYRLDYERLFIETRLRRKNRIAPYLSEARIDGRIVIPMA